LSAEEYAVLPLEPWLPRTPLESVKTSLSGRRSDPMPSGTIVEAYLRQLAAEQRRPHTAGNKHPMESHPPLMCRQGELGFHQDNQKEVRKSDVWILFC